MTTETQDVMDRYRAEIRRVEGAPLSVRVAARSEWRDALADPDRVAERILCLVDGHYGPGAFLAVRQLMMRGRGNKVVALAQMVAALEWGCPARFARESWRTLTRRQRNAVHGAIDAAMVDAEVY